MSIPISWILGIRFDYDVASMADAIRAVAGLPDQFVRESGGGSGIKDFSPAIDLRLASGARAAGLIFYRTHSINPLTNINV